MSDLLVMSTPQPDLRTRLTAQVDYASEQIRRVLAQEDFSLRILKTVRNGLSSLRSKCNAFTAAPGQVETIRTMALQTLGEIAALNSSQGLTGKPYLPHATKALQLLVQTIADRPTPPANDQRAA